MSPRVIHAVYVRRRLTRNKEILDAQQYSHFHYYFCVSLRAQRAWQSDEVVASVSEAIPGLLRLRLATASLLAMTTYLTRYLYLESGARRAPITTVRIRK